MSSVRRTDKAGRVQFLHPTAKCSFTASPDSEQIEPNGAKRVGWEMLDLRKLNLI